MIFLCADFSRDRKRCLGQGDEAPFLYFVFQRESKIFEWDFFCGLDRGFGRPMLGNS
jgi:hypothetical protein